MTVEYSVQQKVARVTINRMDRMNAVDEETADRLEEIWQVVESDPEIRVVILTGRGDKAFSSGADMKASADAKSGIAYWAEARPGGFGGLALRKSLKVPVIGRVNGLAVGGGFEMVLGCDIVIAADHATFGFPEPRVGRMPLDGGMILLPRLIPQKVAMGMLLTGKRISAQDAERYGIVNQVVDAADLDDAVDKWVHQILECAPLSVKAIKESVRETSHLSLAEAHAMRLPVLMDALQSEDADEGPLAFREKRQPVWKGK